LHLTAITYVSRPRLRSDGPEMRALLARCARNNRAAQVTGALYHDGALFLQTLEGPQAVVERLYRRIAEDPRHRDVTLLRSEPLTRRRFGAWDMKPVDGRRFAHMPGYFARERLLSAGPSGIERRLRLMARL
jgi:hypothetical protein